MSRGPTARQFGIAKQWTVQHISEYWHLFGKYGKPCLAGPALPSGKALSLLGLLIKQPRQVVGSHVSQDPLDGLTDIAPRKSVLPFPCVGLDPLHVAAQARGEEKG